MDDFMKICGTDLIIFVPSELDHHNAKKIRICADRMMESRNIKRILFDFQKTNFMDSSGIGVIMGRYKNMHFMGGTVEAVHVNERVKKILTLSGVSKIIRIYEGLPMQSNIV